MLDNLKSVALVFVSHVDVHGVSFIRYIQLYSYGILSATNKWINLFIELKRHKFKNVHTS